MVGLLYTIATICLVVWLFSFLFHAAFAFAGGFIHLLLVVAVVLFVIGLLRGRGAAV